MKGSAGTLSLHDEVSRMGSTTAATRGGSKVCTEMALVPPSRWRSKEGGCRCLFWCRCGSGSTTSTGSRRPTRDGCRGWVRWAAGRWGLFHAENDPNEVSLLEEWESHDQMHEASEKYGDEFNETAGTVGKDWETRIWHRLT